MQSADQVIVFRPAHVINVLSTVYCILFGGVGVGFLASAGHTGWPGAGAGLVIIAMTAFLVADAVTKSVTIHEQGVVVRQNLRRRFVPWDSVQSIWCTSGTSLAPLYRGMLSVSTGVKYVEKRVTLGGAAGPKKYVQPMVDQMTEAWHSSRAPSC
jgi:Bacterial PH domain